MRSFLTFALVASTVFALAGCSTAPKTEESREALQTDAQQALAHFKRQDSSLDRILDGDHQCPFGKSIEHEASFTIGGSDERRQVGGVALES